MTNRFFNLFAPSAPGHFVEPPLESFNMQFQRAPDSERARATAPSGRARMPRMRAGTHGVALGIAPMGAVYKQACTHGNTFGPRPWAPRACGRTRKRLRDTPECAACERARTGARPWRTRVRRVRAGLTDAHSEYLQSAPRAREQARNRLRDTPECAACVRARTDEPSGYARVRRVRAGTHRAAFGTHQKSSACERARTGTPPTCTQVRRVRAGTHGCTFGKRQTSAACERARAEAPSAHAQKRRVRAGSQRIAFDPPQSAPRTSGH